MKKLIFLFLPLTFIACQSAEEGTIQNNTAESNTKEAIDTISKDYGDSISLDNFDVIQEFIHLVGSRNIEKISEKVIYPLRRKHPIPPVKNKEEFIKRFYEIFDDSFLQEISDMNNMEKWSELTEDEIMFDNGKLWIDSQGNLIAINQTSAYESKASEDIIVSDRANLHESIKQFEKPILEMKTKNYLIRIDDLGDYNYRYASWPIDKNYSDKPELIIKNGEQFLEGSGGNHRYEFNNGNYKYICSRIHLGKDDTPGKLTILNNEKEILSEDAYWLAD